MSERIGETIGTTTIFTTIWAVLVIVTGIPSQVALFMVPHSTKTYFMLLAILVLNGVNVGLIMLTEHWLGKWEQKLKKQITKKEN